MKPVLNLVPSKHHPQGKKHLAKLVKSSPPKHIAKDVVGATPVPVVDHVDHTDLMPPVQDQGELGSCSANATQAIHYAFLKSCGISEPELLARLYQYLNSRALDSPDMITEDSGASMASAVMALLEFGYIPEAKLPYDISKFTTIPDGSNYLLGQLVFNNYPFSAQQVNQDLASLKSALKLGPVMAGVPVFAEIQSDVVAKTGLVPMPKAGEKPIGGHAICLVGFSDQKTTPDGKPNPYYQHFKVRNSWGPGWGLGGYCWIPYAYFTDPSWSEDYWILVADSDEMKDAHMTAVTAFCRHLMAKHK